MVTCWHDPRNIAVQLSKPSGMPLGPKDMGLCVRLHVPRASLRPVGPLTWDATLHVMSHAVYQTYAQALVRRGS